MNQTSKLVVLGFIENQNNKFLICQRYEPNLSVVHLKWDLPGGKNEPGESLEQTVLREIAEETGLNVKIEREIKKTIFKIWYYPDHELHTTLKCFYCSLIDGALRLGDHKINNLLWISKDKISEFDFIPTSKEFIELVCKKC